MLSLREDRLHLLAELLYLPLKGGVVPELLRAVRELSESPAILPEVSVSRAEQLLAHLPELPKKPLERVVKGLYRSLRRPGLARTPARPLLLAGAR
jgi:hypothetical protein